MNPKNSRKLKAMEPADSPKNLAAQKVTMQTRYSFDFTNRKINNLF
jgi:hypothetical protein